jgi:hypothetical protein
MFTSESPNEEREFASEALRQDSTFMRCRHFGTNLIDSFSRVQQLLVRVIFLPGLSDRSKPICHLTFRWEITSRMRSGRFRRTESSRPRHAHLPRRAGTWTQAWENNEYAAATKTGSQGRLIRRPACSCVRVAFADQSPSGENSLHEVSRRTTRSTWSGLHVRLLFLPGITE